VHTLHMKDRAAWTLGLMAGLFSWIILFSPVPAAAGGLALIVSNTAYSVLPPLPACALSSRAISAALTGRGYDVIKLTDGSAGQLDGAMNQLADRLRATPDVPMVIYFCGYVVGQNGRPFLVPAPAALERPSDILSQGILAKNLIDVAAKAGRRPALVVLEAVGLASATESMALGSLDRSDLPPGVGLLGVTDVASDPSPRLASALVQRLKAESLRVGDLVTSIQHDPDGMVSASVVLAHLAADPVYLLGEPPLPPPELPNIPQPEAPALTVDLQSGGSVPSQPLPDPEVGTAAQGTVAELPGMSPPGATPEVAALALPDEEQMTVAMRRDVQTKLTALGYYAGAVDGIFAADTRAAIRRLQHELQEPMTGRLTGAEASKLMTLR